jgi:pimeloyl-ACP methyl ester carboxylesterase
VTTTAPQAQPRQHSVQLSQGRPELAVREFDGQSDGQFDGQFNVPRRPFLLVHGLASNARLWDGVGRHLAAAGHRVVAVDLRGHGLSQQPPGGYDTDTNADDLAALTVTSGLRGPVVAGQSWGGNVVLSLAARHPGVAAAVACVDGGWLRPRDDFASFEECWGALAPPVLDGVRFADVAHFIASAHPDWPAEGVEATLANLVELPGGGVRARLAREHHRDIVRSLFEGDPARWYPVIGVPVLLVPAVGEHPAPDDGERSRGSRAAVEKALAALPHGEVRWYAGADHDLHAQHPQRLAADLLALAATVDTPDTTERTA